MKEVESETILTKFIETRKNLGMKGKLKMKPLLGNLHSSFSKLDDIAQKVFTGINMNETLEKINDTYKLSKKDMAMVVLMVKIKEESLSILTASLMEHHLRNMQETGVEMPPVGMSSNGNESERYIQ